MALKSCPYFTKQVHGRMCQRCLWSHSCLNGYSTNSLKKKKSSFTFQLSLEEKDSPPLLGGE